jgi:hypothetical protein
MAETITLTYSAGSFSRSRTFPNGSGVRAIAAAKARLNMAPASTNAAVFNAMADELFESIRQNTVNYERQQAAETAAVGVADMPLS